MAEDFEVTGGENQGMRKGMQDATFPLYEQYLEHELTVRCLTEPLPLLCR